MFKLLFCFFVCVAWAQAVEYEFVTPPKELVTQIFGIGQTCITESGAEADVLQKVMSGTYSNDLPSKKFITCFIRKGHFGDSDGYLDKATILPVFQSNKKVTILERVIEQCNEDARKANFENKDEKAFSLMNCIHKNSPIKPKLD